MLKHSRLHTLACALALVLTGSTAASAHPEHGGGSGDNSDGVVDEQVQHPSSSGHLPALNRNVQVVGKAQVTNPSGLEGRVADVAAYGNHAFLTAFRDPVCQRGGAHVIDISNPAAPFEVTSAFMETTPHNYAGEGAQTLAVSNSAFQGVLFLHNNETCPGAPAPTVDRTRGGIHLWDITDATAPQLLAAHAGDYTGAAGAALTQARTVHSVFAWNNVFDGRTYAVLVDNEEFTDVDILDISDPRNPVLVNDSLDLVALFGVDQAMPQSLRSIFNHDMVVKRIGERYVMSVNYWDGGYVLLDVTDPAPGKVTLIGETDYAALDEERLARGHEIAPEGNSHYSELSPDNRFLIGTDEDFNPRRVVATITSGPWAGTEYTATSASDTPPITAGTTVTGTPTFVGVACTALPAGSGVALVERGTCSFQVKLDTIKAAGYSAGLVFNTLRSDCMSGVRMLAAGDIPFLFVDRLAGLQLLQVPGVSAANACTTPSPAPGSPAASTHIASVFDGWGYVRIFRTQIPGDVGTSGRIQQVGTYTIPEAQDPAYAEGFGDLSVHEVAIDPNAGRRLAYFSYYAGGFRVAEYGDFGLREVGAFIDQGGSNFWGVEVHAIAGQQYVLASDRDYGLYILQYKPRR